MDIGYFLFRKNAYLLPAGYLTINEFYANGIAHNDYGLL